MNFNNQFEIIDMDFLTEAVIKLLSDEPLNNSLQLHCGMLMKFNWNYQRHYEGKDITTYWYYCSQRDDLAKKPRKNPESAKQQDVSSKERYNCEGIIKISIDEYTQIAEITLLHKDLHMKPIDKSLPQSVKDFIKENINLLPREIYARLVNEGLDISIRQKQVHFWVTQLGQGRYKRPENAFDSACLWLLENNYHIILQEVEPVRALAFETGILKQINELGINIHECGIDAAYKTNNMGFELYVLHAEVNGIGVPLSCLFLENNDECKDGIRTYIIQNFLTKFRDQVLQPKFFHIKRAITTRLSSNKKTRTADFNPLSEFGKRFPFDGIQQTTQFCPKDLREPLKLQQIHNGRERPDWIKDFKYKWKNLIKQPVTNMYITDVENWICGCSYYLTSRFKLCKHLVQQKGIVTDKFFENIRRNYQPPFLIEYNLSSHVDNNKENVYTNMNIMNEPTAEEDTRLFDELIDTTKKALTLLEEQKSVGNIKWCKGAKNSFNGIVKLVNARS
ncbi:ATP-dependent DNA helicase Pif1 [Rhizophagus clarus]|uniref:ATP-dependent DNA helicase Pif1 n=1 Tax=Rhizophagus clarus TaxID=94130 RepID=A0A8H3QQ90_9GLOM|nr:ATP-dependent DNA helicase Pif1 [Rhizophagus clarus]